jgi:hypothetical protein
VHTGRFNIVKLINFVSSTHGIQLHDDIWVRGCFSLEWSGSFDLSCGDIRTPVWRCAKEVQVYKSCSKNHTRGVRGLQLIVQGISVAGVAVRPALGVRGQALQPELIADDGVRVVVAVPRPVRRGRVHHPQPPVPEARLPHHRQRRQLVVLLKAKSTNTTNRIKRMPNSSSNGKLIQCIHVVF